MTNHNGMPVKTVVAGLHYEVADFRGRYVSQMASDEQEAVAKFVFSRTCNSDTPFLVAQAWREAGCPERT